MAIDIEIWWLRSLSLIMVVPFLGPHLVAIGKMVRNIPIEETVARTEFALDQRFAIFHVYHCDRYVRLWRGVSFDGLLS